MTTIHVKIENYPGMDVAWVRPANDSVKPLFMFVTGGSIGVPAWKWEQEVEPVLTALGWWWSIDPLTAQLVQKTQQLEQARKGGA